MPEECVQELDVTRVITPEDNRKFDPAGCEPLRESIRAEGQLVPGIVYRAEKGQFICVEGNRRLYCCRILGIPFKAIIAEGEPSKAGIIKMRLATNCIREAMNPVDVGRDVSDYMQEHGITSQAEAAQQLSLSVSALNRALGTNRIREDLRGLARQVPHCSYLISTLPTAEMMKEVLTAAIGPPVLTRDQVAKLVAEKKAQGKPKKAKPIRVKVDGADLSVPTGSWDSILNLLGKLTEAAKKGAKGGYPTSMFAHLLKAL